MLERVDLDKKWFYMTEVATSYILVPGETPPRQTCKHKSHIKKVTCLTAVARPLQNPHQQKDRHLFFVEQFLQRELPKIDPQERWRRRASRWARKNLLRCIWIISFRKSSGSGQSGGPRRCKSSWITRQRIQSWESWEQR